MGHSECSSFDLLVWYCKVVVLLALFFPTKLYSFLLLQTHGILEIHETWFANEGYLQIHIGSPKLWYGMSVF